MNGLSIVCRQQLGDLVLHQPAIEYLSHTEGMPATVFTRSTHRALVELMPNAHFGEPIGLCGRHKTYCFDSKASSLLFAATILRGHRTLLVPAKKIRFLQRLLFDRVIDSDKGARYTALALFIATGGQIENFRPPRLQPPPADWHLPSAPKRYILLHPTSAWQRKCLAPEHWINVLGSLGVGLPVVLTSGNADWERQTCKTIENGLQTVGLGVLNLAGTTSLRNYLALLSRASLTLCVDGSSSHISSAFSRPTFTLFGPTNPVHWHWPDQRSAQLWARDFSSEQYPSANSIPERAMLHALESFLGCNPL